MQGRAVSKYVLLQVTTVRVGADAGDSSAHMCASAELSSVHVCTGVRQTSMAVYKTFRVYLSKNHKSCSTTS